MTIASNSPGQPPPDPDQEPKKTSVRVWAALGGLVLFFGGVFGTAVGEDIYDALFHTPDPPSPDSQLRDIQTEIERQHRRVIVLKTAPIRGAGPESHVLLVRPTATPATGDEVRIYDEDDDGKLVETFSYRPRPGGLPQSDALVDILPDRLVVSSLDVRDFDGVPGSEMVFGLYEVNDRRQRFPRPMLLRWSAGKGRYVVAPMLSPRTVRASELEVAVTRRYLNRSMYARLLRTKVYTRATLLEDDMGNALGQAYPVEAFRAVPRTREADLTPGEGDIELVTGYIVGSSGIGTAREFQLVRWDVQIPADEGPSSATPVPGPVIPVNAERSNLADIVRREAIGG